MWLVAACGNASVVDETSTTSTASPALMNGVVTAAIGEAIYSEQHIVDADRVTINAAIVRRWGSGSVSVPKGDILVARREGQGTEYCTLALRYIDPISGPYSTVCFEDKDGNQKLDTATVPVFIFDGSKSLSQEASVWPDASIGVGDEIRKELIYLGVVRNTLKIGYREVGADQANPVFSQNFTFPLTRGKADINVQSFEAELLSASGDEISLRLKSGFADNQATGWLGGGLFRWR